MGAIADPRHWWRCPWALERFLGDLIDAEARRMRPGGPWPPRVAPPDIAATMPDERGLGFDSLERIGLAAALSEALHLHRGGLGDTLITAPTLGGWLEAAAASLERFSDRVTIRSSGSSGPSHRHGHSMDALTAEVEILRHLLTNRRRVRSAVASHHIYGLLFTLMLPEDRIVTRSENRSREAAAASSQPPSVGAVMSVSPSPPR
jgi:long-chain acyl-CoA synthetase